MGLLATGAISPRVYPMWRKSTATDIARPFTNAASGNARLRRPRTHEARMMLRRVRGFIVTTAVCGVAALGFVVTATIALWLFDSHHVGGRLLHELAISGSLFLGYGLTVGAVLASLLMLAERSSTLETLSAWRLRVGGAIAGALPVVVTDDFMRLGGATGGYRLEAFGVASAGFIGWRVAAGMLWLARRAERRRES